MYERVLQHLQTYHKGRSKAISSRKLEAIFKISGAELRWFINKMRGDGHPVCSGSTGYYYAGSKRELNATIAQLSSRVDSIKNARDGLTSALCLYKD